MNSLRWIKAILYTMACILIIVPIVYRSYPKQYESIVEAKSKHYDVDPLLVYAIIKAESSFNPDALSVSGAKGLMQIMNQTGTWGAKECELTSFEPEDLFNPEINITIGVWYISKLLKQYDNHLDTALAAYNAGSGNVAKWRSNKEYSQDGIYIHTIPFKETKKYIKRVVFNYKVYQLLYRN